MIDILGHELEQRCPTLSPIATCGDKDFKCGYKHNNYNFVFMGAFENLCELSQSNCQLFYIIKIYTKHVPKLKQKISFFMFSKKCGDSGASVATFVATLVFTLDTADVVCSMYMHVHSMFM